MGDPKLPERVRAYAARRRRGVEARVCERCGHAFVIAARFTAVICGPCQQARDAQKAAIDQKFVLPRVKDSIRGRGIDIGRVTMPPDEEE